MGAEGFFLYFLLSLAIDQTQLEKGMHSRIFTIYFPDVGEDIIVATQYTGLNKIKNVTFKTAPQILYNVWEDYPFPYTTHNSSSIPYYNHWTWIYNWLKYNYYSWIRNLFCYGSMIGYQNLTFENSFYSIMNPIIEPNDITFYEKMIRSVLKLKKLVFYLYDSSKIIESTLVLFSKGKGASILLDFIFKTPIHILDEFPIHLVIIESLDKKYVIPENHSCWYRHVPLVITGNDINKNFTSNLHSLRPDLFIYEIEHDVPLWKNYQNKAKYKTEIERIYMDIIHCGRGESCGFIHDPKYGRTQKYDTLFRKNDDVFCNNNVPSLYYAKSQKK
jgi:hypothetical protein